MADRGDAHQTYQRAVEALNGLLLPAAEVKQAATDADRALINIPRTKQCLQRIGMSMDQLDRLSAIHVSGTKGKGSVCAFCDSILRAHGYTTGFFSSPHLIEPRERIRINGRPINQELFSKYFWYCYGKLLTTKAQYDGYMPTYFGFMTVMAFYAFVEENVDAGIIEVGIGGEYDNTNVIQKPYVCGVTSLGIDHTKLLGETLEEIAWHKGGIFKNGVPAVSVLQADGAIRVLEQRAMEAGSPFFVAPTLSSYDSLAAVKDSMAGPTQAQNASLALQLTNIWLQLTQTGKYNASFVLGSHQKELQPFTLTEPYVQGIKQFSWPGRNQVLQISKNLVMFLDGAHTAESIVHCSRWFCSASKRQSKGNVIKRVLLFNLTRERTPEKMLPHVRQCHFDAALFCPNVIFTSSQDASADSQIHNQQMAQCIQNKECWDTLSETKLSKNGAMNKYDSQVFATIEDAVAFIRDLCDDNPKETCHVLCTGSLYLVGGILRLLEPDLCDK